MDAVKVGLIGFGTVGKGVAQELQGNAAVISERLGFPLELARVADKDTTSDRGVALAPGVLGSDARALIEDPALPIVIELIGGTDKSSSSRRCGLAWSREQGAAGAGEGLQG
jgi:homoserine dehydrogenase